ncbi:hypothetical protein [Streptomyces sp. NPDC050988]|uniref:hypothetical protein n=1 Tax=Streptomyces sp. NPDC050988 TaxID=3365637 RepID=UPI00379E52D3
MGREKANKQRRRRPAQSMARPTMVVAVNERDYEAIPAQARQGDSFAAYWSEAWARTNKCLAEGGRPLLRPLIVEDFTRFCQTAGLSVRSPEAFAAYAAQEVPENDLVVFLGEPSEMLLHIMVLERDAVMMMARCNAILRAAVDQFGEQARAWARSFASAVLDAVLEQTADGDEVILVAKAGGGLLLGSFALSLPCRGREGERDHRRLSTLLAASCLAGAKGVLGLRKRTGHGVETLVWELADQRLTPSDHGRLILEPDASQDELDRYLPGFPLPHPA